MKKVFVAAFLLIALSAGAQQQFTVKGKIGHYNAPGYAILNYQKGNESVVDTLEIKDGAFEASGNVAKTTKAMILISPQGVYENYLTRNVVNFYLEAGTITITSADYASRAKVAGTPTNVAQQQYQDMLVPIAAKRDSAQQVYNDFSTLMAEEKMKQVRAYIAKYPESPILYTVMSEYMGRQPSLELQDSMYNALPAISKKSVGGKELEAKIRALKSVTVGSMAPDFTQKDTAGLPVSLKSFRGKYVLVDFWASWCVPCRAENPHVVEAYHKYKDKNFTVLGVSLDREKDGDLWIKAIHDDKLEWTQVSDLQFWNNSVVKMYGVNSIPANFLINPKGRIVAKGLRGAALEAKLAELLK
ncbi:TlpA disulfide reductase family protein [uncultured Chitinophaga sp.]|uniref:TlpA disulfide reductase family protein n=1 Tax=uncultured Chitinophaga sp. TaxID=339340 RepID=UPI0025F8C576|nr:TlpA disulfide reductase family protein [uncultured Chitinophaga sp.]